MKKLLVIISLGILFILEFSLIAGEWNEKPVMCASEEETFQSLKAKGEKIYKITKTMPKPFSLFKFISD